MNPVIVTLGSFELRWYSVLILVGALLALFLIEKEAKRFGINKEFVFNMLFWGIFFNSEAHGVATTYEHLKSLRIPEFIINGMHIDGVYYTPTFFYESIACLILFIVLLFVRRSKYVKVGTLSALYLIGYGIIRFFIEISRTDALMIGAFKIAQIVSIIMVIVGIVILMINARKSKFEDLYNDENNIEKVRF